MLFRVVKHAIVGTLEAIALGVMVGASNVFTPTGTYFIFVGLFIGVIGLAIHEVWRV